MNETNLKTLARNVKKAHEAVCTALRSSLGHAKKAGEYLSQVAADMPSKDFCAWAKKECGLSDSTAYNYIRIHKHWQEVKDEANYVKALKALRATRKPASTAPACNSRHGSRPLPRR